MASVNKFLHNRLVTLSAGIESARFKKLVARAVYLDSVGVNSSEKLETYIFVKNASKSLGVTLNILEIEKILSYDSKSENDIFYAISKTKIESAGIRKIAYPNPGLSSESISEEFNINEWLDIVYKIYNSIESGEMSKTNAIEYYSGSLDEKEQESFLNWFNYYSSGEHMKYSEKKKGAEMKKEAIYQSDLGQGNNPYYSGSGSSYLEKNTGNNMPGDSFGRGTFDEASKLPSKSLEEKGAFNTWKQQLYGAIRRVDKLIRSDTYVEHEDYKDLSEALSNLSILAKKIKLARTLSDITYKTASTFERAGSKEAAGILRKIAQEVPMEDEFSEPVQPAPAVAEFEPAPPAEAIAAPPAEAQVAAETGLSSQEEASGAEIPGPNDVEPISLRDIAPIPGAAPGEYEALAGDITLVDASNKLDEVAGLLADRRIIRQLAEFDIMLDKIGIASMFPELAESQSKLIDAFSYALTRVTKMMGQLANASIIANSRSGIPGADSVQEEQIVEEQIQEGQSTDLDSEDEQATPVEVTEL